jgi:DNA-binding transcriptional LysR family regulator
MDPFQDLNNLFFFARVVDFGSFTAAAEALGLQTSKLSRRVGALENELGVRLLNRTTRKLSLTEAGKTFHRHCVALIAEAEAAKDAINQTLSAPRGVVRVSCPTGLLQGGVANILAKYLGAHPQVSIALEATNRRVDVIDGNGRERALVAFPRHCFKTDHIDSQSTSQHRRPFHPTPGSDTRRWCRVPARTRCYRRFIRRRACSLVTVVELSIRCSARCVPVEAWDGARRPLASRFLIGRLRGQPVACQRRLGLAHASFAQLATRERKQRASVTE